MRKDDWDSKLYLIVKNKSVTNHIDINLWLSQQLLNTSKNRCYFYSKQQVRAYWYELLSKGHGAHGAVGFSGREVCHFLMYFLPSVPYLV